MSTATEFVSATDDEIFSGICKLLAPLNYSGIELKLETDISADLNIDSVTVMDFVMEVEDHFDIEIPLNILSETRTIEDLIKVVQAGLQRREFA